MARLKRKGKHSIAGTEYKAYGDKGYEGKAKERQRQARLKRRIAAINTRQETTTQKSQGTYVSPSVSSRSEFPGLKEWAKQQGRSITQRLTIDYSKAKKQWQARNK